MSAGTISDRIDWEQLSAPISDERPAGEYLRYEGTYDRIREARREDDATLSQGIYKTELKKANWSEVERLCTDALMKRTKDIQINAWLMEAWLRLHGFAGCRDGLQLLIELIEKYWPVLHPQLGEDDPEHRIGTFVWINEKLSMQLKLIPITAPQANDLLPYSFADWEMACHLEQLAERNQSAPSASESSASVSLTRFQASAMLTSTQSYLKLFDDLNGTAQACLALDDLLEEKLGKQSPGLQRFKEMLGDIQRLVADILHARPEEPELPNTGQETQLAAAEGHEPGSEMWSAHPIRSRAEAYWRLSEAADYLLRTEPHSPTPYLVQRAVEWGSMNLFDLFQQIIRNEGEMQEINKLLRLTNKEEGG
ncbi:MAG TPA: type VI secretion system protein TssA [Pyrinomonadaceae bacterium]|jgi:type VI secretion system protein ImpA|nr:type VI secretion system protein TssA [Pyrinomonadaceae bacterium]